MLRKPFIIANMKYYNFERESHLQWSDNSRELTLWFCSLNLGLTEVTFPSVGALPHLHIKPLKLLTTYTCHCFCGSKLKFMTTEVEEAFTNNVRLPLWSSVLKSTQ